MKVNYERGLYQFLALYRFFSYALAVVLIQVATLTYRTNLNIRRRIEVDATLEERHRMRREIHDGVAQVLNYLTWKTGLVSAAVSSQNVAQALFISENTVKTHLRNILDKLHLVNRSQAVAYAARAGLLKDTQEG